MKFSTIVTVLAVALCFAGCKYNKAGKGGAGDDNATGSDISTMEGQEGDISGITGGQSFADKYTLCTDVDFAPVYFGFDSSVVPSDEIGKIDQVAQHLNDNSNRVVSIHGHCDERGSNEYNMPLGENRAIIIRNYLVQSGIDTDRIETISYGEEKPAVDGHDESAWSKNRRGEFAIYQK